MRRWLADRLGAAEARAFLAKKLVPPNCGWLQTLGVAAMTVFALQVVTGIALSWHYVPSTLEAHPAIAWMMEHVTAGRFIRGLHIYGASAMVVVVVLHLTRVIATRAYQPPRELTWLMGLILFALVLGFGFTGYLLPWDQKAYWATVVGTQIAGDVPLIGPALHRLMVGGDSLGALTLTRFFAIHVFILPLLFLMVLGAHLYLIDRYNVRGPEGNSEGQSGPGFKPYFPDHFVKETVVAMVALGLIVALATVRPAELGPIADPSDATFSPRPEWYFLPLFQLLKYFPGPLEVVGTVVVPGLLALFLATLPWIDAGKRRPLVRGSLATIGVAALVLLTLGAMDRPEPTVASPVTKISGSSITPIAGVSGPAITPLEIDGVTITPTLGIAQFLIPPDWLKPEHAALGSEVYVRANCANCHQLRGEGYAVGPALDGVGERRTTEWLLLHFLDPPAVVPKSTMPPFKGTRDELLQLTAYVLSLTREDVTDSSD